MRLGERRVLPIVVVNEWRRERTVTIKLGDWTGCPGDASVTVHGLVHPTGELTLAPCERRELVVDVAALPALPTAVPPVVGKDVATEKPQRRQTARGAQLEETLAAPTAVSSVLIRGDQLGDVGVCATYCAELVIEGCSHRPVRLAAQVLPRTCDAYEVNCSCGCC